MNEYMNEYKLISNDILIFTIFQRFVIFCFIISLSQSFAEFRPLQLHAFWFAYIQAFVSHFISNCYLV